MTNEELKRMANYAYQIRAFALSLKDDAWIVNNNEWKGFAKRLLILGNEMDKALDDVSNEKEID